MLLLQQLLLLVVVVVWALTPTMRDDDVETFLHWTAGEGRKRDPAIAAWYDQRPEVLRTF